MHYGPRPSISMGIGFLGQTEAVMKLYFLIPEKVFKVAYKGCQSNSSDAAKDGKVLIRSDNLKSRTSSTEKK